MKKYYFKYIVPSHYEIKHNTYKQAVKTAKKLNESIYLQVFSYSNKYNEPYSEIKLTLTQTESELKYAKEILTGIIKTYLILPI